MSQESSLYITQLAHSSTSADGLQLPRASLDQLRNFYAHRHAVFTVAAGIPRFARTRSPTSRGSTPRSDDLPMFQGIGGSMSSRTSSPRFFTCKAASGSFAGGPPLVVSIFLVPTRLLSDGDAPRVALKRAIDINQVDTEDDPRSDRPATTWLERLHSRGFGQASSPTSRSSQAIEGHAMPREKRSHGKLIALCDSSD